MRNRRMLIGLAVAMLSIAASVLALRLYLVRPAEDRLYPDEKVTIAALKSPLPGNSALACPPDYCAAAESIPSPVFAVGWERLLEKLDRNRRARAAHRGRRLRTRATALQRHPAFRGLWVPRHHHLRVCPAGARPIEHRGLQSGTLRARRLRHQPKASVTMAESAAGGRRSVKAASAGHQGPWRRWDDGADRQGR